MKIIHYLKIIPHIVILKSFPANLQLATGIAAAAHWSINIVPLRNHKLCSQPLKCEFINEVEFELQ